MGTELIGLMVVGPADYTPEQIARCKRVARLHRSRLARAARCLKTTDKGAIHPDLFPRLAAAVEHLLEACEDVTDPEYLLDELELQTPEDADHLINDFIDLWRGGSRDSGSRELIIDGRKMQVLFAGEPTWGNEPSGFGYQVLKRLAACDLFTELGLQ